MRLALTELIRRPGRFAVAGAALTFITVLLVFLGGLLDGLYLNSTGAIRAQDADLVVFSSDSRQSIIRSRIEVEVRDQVADLDAVASTGGLGFTLLGGEVPGQADTANTAVVGYELAPSGVPEPPPPGQAHADRLLEPDGVSLGEVIAVGPAGTPLEPVSWVDDTNYLQQGSLWVSPETWRQVTAANRPDIVLAEGSFQVLVVRLVEGADADQVAAAIDDATGVTETLTVDEAVLAIPGIAEQNATFNGVIFTTFAVAGLVIALFFALLTIERVPLYGVFKAVGAPDRSLFAGVVAQAVAVAVGAFVLGAAIGVGLAAVIPDEVPVQIESSRIVFVFVGVVATAVIGSLFSLRRVIRIDPASAIGRGS